MLQRKQTQGGFILVSTLMVMSILLTLLGAYFFTTNIELVNARYLGQNTKGFYAAEAGLNLRAEHIRALFQGYNRPTGTSPNATDPCATGNVGAGDFACVSNTIERHSATTYVTEDPGNPVLITIPPGERFQNLSAQEYRYAVNSIGKSPDDRTEAQLELRFKSRLVPMFQFAVFYNKDLEILPGPSMQLNGPVHTNGDIYLNTNTLDPGLRIDGQVTTAKDVYRGRKDQDLCLTNKVQVKDPLNYRRLIASCSTRRLVQTAELTPWNGMIQNHVSEVTVPDPEEFDPTAGATYWDKADLRIVLHLDGTNNPVTTAPRGIEVRNANDTIDSTATNLLGACTGSVSQIGNYAVNSITNYANAFYNNREDKYIKMLEVDMRSLLDCLHNSNWLTQGKALNDDTEGGIVFFFTVKGPDASNTANKYGVRIWNAQNLQATVGGAPLVKGMSIVSDQAVYLRGHYNSTNKIPAAVMADSINILSGNLNDGATDESNLTNRTAADTTVNAAFLSGTDSTGNTEGTGGWNGAYNGGVENFPRFHENWSNRTFTYKGSIVSLNKARHVNGAWQINGRFYNAPTRVWSFDTDFNDAAKLPPLSPRFVYLKQELFVRDFEQ